MATNPQTSLPGKMRKLVERYEERAGILRAALKVLDEESETSAVKRGATTLRHALTQDAARRGNGRTTLDEETGRQRTAARLAEMSRTVPSQFGSGASSVLKYGYIARKGDGYVRTAKPYPLTRDERERRHAKKKTIPANKRPGYGSKASKVERKQHMAEYIAQFDRVEPRPAKGRGLIGNVVRLGYLRAKGDGYIRTAKPFPGEKRSATPREMPPTNGSESTPPVWIAGKKRYGPAAKKRRAKTAEFLAQFSTTEPRQITGKPLAALARRGYLRREGDGYVRTEAPFTP